MSISSTASSALRPRHGAPAACAVSPLNVYCTDTRPVPVAVAPRHVQVVADVREERDVDVLEQSGAHEVRLGADQLFGRAGPDADRAGQLLALHDLLHRERRGDVHRLPELWPSPWPGAPSIIGS